MLKRLLPATAGLLMGLCSVAAAAPDGTEVEQGGLQVIEADPEPPLALGQIYCERLWVRDCLGALRQALAIDPALRELVAPT